MKPVIPHEHGGWAFLIVPFILGTWLGKPNFYHLSLFIAWLLFYLATYSLQEWIKRKRKETRYQVWMLIYGLVGSLFLITPLSQEPTLAFVAPLLLISVIIHFWHIQKRNERAMLNNLGTVHAFSMGAVAAYVLGTGTWDFMALFIYIYCATYLLGTVFFVKSVIRERKNPHWLGYAKIYHGLMFIVPIVFGHPWLAIPYLFSLIRLYGWGGTAIKPLQAGIIEIVNAIQFTLLTILLS